MARFLILSINYAPEPTGFAPHAAALAQHLARAGDDVDVFTGFPFAPRWRRRAEDRGRWSATERDGRLTVHRLTHYIPRRPSRMLERVAMEGSFAIAGLLRAIPMLLRRDRRPDAVLYIGAQPAIAMLARLVAALAGCPYFINVNDLAAQAAADVGIAGGFAQRLLERFEFSAYRAAAGASVLCGSFERVLTTHGFTAPIELIRSPIDVEQIRPVARDRAFRAAHGIPEHALVILHAGSMGRKQGLMNVIEAASRTRGVGLCWVFAGDGETRAELVEAVSRQDLDTEVKFIPFQSDAQMSAMFAAADVLLLNQISAVKDAVIPSKLLTYMAAGRPVLAAVNATSQGAEILQDAGGGWLVAPEDPAQLAAMALHLRGERWCFNDIGDRNREYAEANFDQRRILVAHEQFMHRLLIRTRRVQAPAA